MWYILWIITLCLQSRNTEYRDIRCFCVLFLSLNMKISKGKTHFLFFELYLLEIVIFKHKKQKIKTKYIDLAKKIFRKDEKSQFLRGLNF